MAFCATWYFIIAQALCEKTLTFFFLQRKGTISWKLNESGRAHAIQCARCSFFESCESKRGLESRRWFRLPLYALRVLRNRNVMCFYCAVCHWLWTTIESQELFIARYSWINGSHSLAALFSSYIIYLRYQQVNTGGSSDLRVEEKWNVFSTQRPPLLIPRASLPLLFGLKKLEGRFNNLSLLLRFE